jgi:hypothetical protein
LLLLTLVAVSPPLVVPAAAWGAEPQNAPDPGPAAGGQVTVVRVASATTSPGNGNCSAGALALNAINPFSHCNVGSQVVNGLPQVPGDVAGAAGSVAQGVAGDVMDQVAKWMVQAAQTVDGDVMKAATATSTPELSAPWYQQEFGYLAFFGAALAAIVALLGVFSASVRGDPGALGEIFYGILRAGLVTAMVVSLTLLALKVADGISSDVAAHMPAQFFQTLSSAWGAKGWGGLASSALAFITGLVEVVVAVLLWIELLFRDAAIYVAVLFFPFTLAVAIWPRLSEANAKLIRILAIFIAFKPVALIVMMTGANLLLGGISFYGGLAPSAGTILAGLGVLAMAAFAPWALMHLVGLDAGVMGSGGARRSGGGGASASSERGSAGGALGGELFGGMVAYGGGAAAAAAGAGVAGHAGALSAGGSRAGSQAGAQASANGSTGDGGAGGRRVLPGPVAAAAGWLPAGWQTAQTVAAKGQSLADHGAARVHTAAGHGGRRPQAVAAGGNNGSGYSPQGGASPPAPPPGNPGHARDADGPSATNGAGRAPAGGPLYDGARNGPQPPPDLPPPPRREES